MPSRLALAVVGALLLAVIALWLLAWRTATLLPDSLRWFGMPEYAASSVGPLGTIEYRDFRLRGAGPKDPDLFFARRLRLETPGLVWLAWHGFGERASSAGLAEFLGPDAQARVARSGGTPRAFPAAGRLRLDVEGLVPGPGLAVGDLRWIGLATGAPLDAEGCDGIGRFTESHLVEMGIDAAPTRASAVFDATSRDSARITLEIEHPSASRVELEMTLRLDGVRGLLDADWSRSVILERRWMVRDLGLVSARNRWCAQRMGISRDGYVDRHLGAIKRMLAAVGAAPTRELESAYRRYAARGGEMTWHSRPSLTTPVGQLSTFALPERLRIMNATLESVRGRAAPFRFDAAPLPEPSPAPAADLAATPLLGAGPPVDPATPPGAAVAMASGAASATGATAPAPVASPQAPDAVPVAAAPVADPVATAGIAAPATPGRAVATAPIPPPVPQPAVAPPRAVERPVSPAPDSPVATAPAVPSAAEPVPGPRPAPSVLATVRGLVPAAGPVTYADLAQLQGRRIEVRSVYGSVRRGTLEKYTDAAITLRLEQRERGLSVTMPQRTVESVRLLEGRFAGDAAPPPG